MLGWSLQKPIYSQTTLVSLHLETNHKTFSLYSITGFCRQWLSKWCILLHADIQKLHWLCFGPRSFFISYDETCRSQSKLASAVECICFLCQISDYWNYCVEECDNWALKAQFISIIKWKTHIWKVMMIRLPFVCNYSTQKAQTVTVTNIDPLVCAKWKGTVLYPRFFKMQKDFSRSSVGPKPNTHSAQLLPRSRRLNYWWAHIYAGSLCCDGSRLHFIASGFYCKKENSCRTEKVRPVFILPTRLFGCLIQEKCGTQPAGVIGPLLAFWLLRSQTLVTHLQ